MKEEKDKKVSSSPVIEPEPKQGMIVASTVDHPITIKYDGKSVRISARSRENFPDASLVESPLPVGLQGKKFNR